MDSVQLCNTMGSFLPCSAQRARGLRSPLRHLSTPLTQVVILRCSSYLPSCSSDVLAFAIGGRSSVDSTDPRAHIPLPFPQHAKDTQVPFTHWNYSTTFVVQPHELKTTVRNRICLCTASLRDCVIKFKTAFRQPIALLHMDDVVSVSTDRGRSPIVQSPGYMHDGDQEVVTLFPSGHGGDTWQLEFLNA